MLNGVKFFREKQKKELEGKGKKCTQSEIAEFVGVPRSRISMIENGEALPTLAEVELMAEYLEVTPGHLYTAKQIDVIAEMDVFRAQIREQDRKLQEGK